MTNPPDSAPQDKAVELAERIVRVEKWRNSAGPDNTISVDTLLSRAEGNTALVDLAQAVLDKESEIARLYALRLDDAAQVTALRAALEEIKRHPILNLVAGKIELGEPMVLHQPCQKVASAALDATPPAVPNEKDPGQ